MFFKDFVSVKRQKIKRGASQTYDTPSFYLSLFTAIFISFSYYCITAFQLSFSRQYFLDIVELVESFHRRKVVYICMQYLVAYLTQHRVVELEET